MTGTNVAVKATIICGFVAVIVAMILPSIARKTSYRKILLVCVVLFVLYLTIFNRSATERKYNFTPFWSYTRWNELVIRHEILQNIIAFIPFGALMRGSFPGMKGGYIVLVCFIFSLFIESLQFIFALGFSEIDDVVHNTLGGVLGILLYGKGVSLCAWVNKKWNLKKSKE